MAEKKQPSGPWYHRAAVWAFSIALGLLGFWLLGFVVTDLGTWPGPDYRDVERKVVDQALLDRESELREQMDSVETEIRAKQERQATLRDSTDSTQKTMNQLLDIQRLAIEKGQEVSDEEKQSLEEAKSLFLSAQKQYQQINQDVADLMKTRRQLTDQQEQLDERLDVQRDKARERYESLQEWHQIKMASLKLGVLVPLLIAVAVLYVRKRESLYLPLLRAAGVAVAARVVFVMHEHFPERYFKYILILTAIAGVVWILVILLQRVARPPTDWLLNQYREGYERLVCPVCEYPVRRGPLRYRYWTRRSIKKLSAQLDGGAESSDELYTCPACATPLYVPCSNCEQIRPALMPACPYCGAKRDAAEILEASGRPVSPETSSGSS